MEERIIIEDNIRSKLVSLVNNTRESGGLFLGKVMSEGIYLCEGDINFDGKESFVFDKEILGRYFSVFQKYPEKVRVVLTHVHNCPFGNKVLKYDPYWSVNPELDNLSCERGTIVDEFYISKKSGNQGDNKVAKWFHEECGFDYHLFVHPKRGSEGCVMTSELVDITSYKYDSGNIGKVMEIPTEYSE